LAANYPRAGTGCKGYRGSSATLCSETSKTHVSPRESLFGGSVHERWKKLRWLAVRAAECAQNQCAKRISATLIRACNYDPGVWMI